MVNLAENSFQNLVLDIGAGAGALTIPLAKQGWRVLAIENDPIFAEKLRHKTRNKENVQVIEIDFLQMRLP